MSSSRRLPFRPVNGIDIAASALARVVPRPLEPALEQARRDVRSLLDGFTGQTESTFRSPDAPSRSHRPLRDIDPLAELLPRALSGRYAALKRDLHVVSRSFAGEHPPPLVARSQRRAPRTKQTAETRTTRRMRVLSVTRDTEQAVTVSLADVSGAPVSFEAGQFLSVRAEVEGETLWRAYSLCTAPGGELAITVKRVDGGRVSNQLNDQLRVGQVLEVRGPSGRFTLPASSTPRHVVLVGGGSGITPLMSHARHLLASEPTTHVSLLYGNRSERDILFRAALAELGDRHGARFTVRHVLEQPAASLSSGIGRLDQDTVLRELAELPEHADAHFLVCGPEPMMQAVRAALLARGIDAARILEERFAAPVEKARMPTLVPREQLVTLRLGTKETALTVQPGQTILEAALAQGAPLDFSCTMGGCGACMLVLREGHVRMDEPNCLSEAERAAGKVLTCVAHPESPCRLERV